jgi:hypothetical protein
MTGCACCVPTAPVYWVSPSITTKLGCMGCALLRQSQHMGLHSLHLLCALQGPVDPDDTIHAAVQIHGNANRMPRRLASPALRRDVSARGTQTEAINSQDTANTAAISGGNNSPTLTSMARPLVSIVLPVYNAAEHLAECLRGIELQTYRPLELSICNNNSNDCSAEVLEEWRPRLEAKGIRWVCTTTGPCDGQGCGLARNVAVRASTGVRPCSECCYSRVHRCAALLGMLLFARPQVCTTTGRCDGQGCGLARNVAIRCYSQVCRPPSRHQVWRLFQSVPLLSRSTGYIGVSGCPAPRASSFIGFS